jgi:phosphohistidine phosphatase
MAHKKYLYLLRHGEAEPGIGPIGDFKRVLSKNGKSHINQLSKDLKNKHTTFDLILVSPSFRTSQTANIISDYLSSKKTVVVDEIYEAEALGLLNLLNNINESVEKLLLIGHNPSLSSLVSYLTGNNSINLFPGMLAVVEVVVEEWKQLGQNTGILKEIM